MERIVVPAREGRAFRVAAGQQFRVIDMEGGQVADTFAYCADDVSEFHSAQHTRAHVDRLFPKVGEQFVTNRRRPILALVEDSSPGIHDMLIAACDPARYELLGVAEWHASCEENLITAMARLGHEHIVVPQPINLFMNTPVADSDGRIEWLPAESRPGDHVVLRAELDCIVCISACPQDIVVINNREPTPVAAEII